MNTRHAITTALITTVLIVTACERKASQDSNSRDNSQNQNPTNADNTGRNKENRNASGQTPMDQSNTSMSVRITADIRKAIMADGSLSTNAKNCKIITDKLGVVTLRGPVASQAEKDSIESMAKAASGVINVVNELEVEQM
jgi:hyperosmotically inducible protein